MLKGLTELMYTLLYVAWEFVTSLAGIVGFAVLLYLLFNELKG